MAALSDITIKTSEYRPCVVNGRKALFHRWEEISKVLPPSPIKGGHDGGTFKVTLGIVELEEGCVTEVYPSDIIFCDNKHQEYCFEAIK